MYTRALPPCRWPKCEWNTLKLEANKQSQTYATVVYCVSFLAGELNAKHSRIGRKYSTIWQCTWRSQRCILFFLLKEIIKKKVKLNGCILRMHDACTWVQSGAGPILGLQLKHARVECSVVEIRVARREDTARPQAGRGVVRTMVHSMFLLHRYRWYITGCSTSTTTWPRPAVFYLSFSNGHNWLAGEGKEGKKETLYCTTTVTQLTSSQQHSGQVVQCTKISVRPSVAQIKTCPRS